MQEKKRFIIVFFIAFAVFVIVWSVLGSMSIGPNKFILGYRYNSDTNSIERSTVSFYGRTSHSENRWGVITRCYYPWFNEVQTIQKLEGKCMYVPESGNNRISCLTSDGEISVYVERGNGDTKTNFFEYLEEENCLTPSDPIYQNRYWFDENLFVYEYEVQKLLKSGKISTASVNSY